MATTKTPPAGDTPRVHPQTQTGQQGTTETQATAQINPISPEDFRNPVVNDYVNSHPPDGIIYVNGLPQRAPVDKPPKPVPVITFEQAARQVVERIYIGLTKDTDTFWSSLGGAIQLGFVLDGFDPRAVRVPFPFNSQQVRDGGMAVIKAVQIDKKAECMNIDLPALGKNVAASLRLDRAREVLEPAFQVVDYNERVVLNQIADTVADGLDLGASVIKGDGLLSRMLKPALLIKGGPTAEGVANRAANDRTEEAIRADEQTKMQAAAPPAAPAPITTVITQTTPPAGSAGPQVPGAPASADPAKKK